MGSFKKIGMVHHFDGFMINSRCNQKEKCMIEISYQVHLNDNISPLHANTHALFNPHFLYKSKQI